MVLTAASLRAVRRLRRRRFWALVAVGVLLGHDSIFAAQDALLAPDRSLADAAHGYWPAFTALAVLVGLLALGGAVAGLVRLRRALRGFSNAPSPHGTPGYAGELLRLWPRLFLSVTLAFAVQENVEHLAVGRGLPGLWVLSWPEYPLAIPVLVAVTLLLAAAGAWLRWRTVLLAGRLAAARSITRWRREQGLAPAVHWNFVAALVAHAWILARPQAGRAPPGLSGA